MDEFVLELDELEIGYDKTPLLKGVSLKIKAGQIVSLIGPNGAGKTTILKVLTRQLKAIGGDVVLLGKNLDTMPASEIAKAASMVMTERPRPELMTVRELVELGRYPYVGTLGILSEEDRMKVDEALNTLKIYDIKDKYFRELSDGQKQRVLLAKALCQEPDLLILDEPTSYLDVKYKIELLQIIRYLTRERGIAIIMSMHELDLALKISDVIAVVDGAGIAAEGTPKEIIESGIIYKVFDLKSDEYDPVSGEIFI